MFLQFRAFFRVFSRRSEEDSNGQEYPFGGARGGTTARASPREGIMSTQERENSAKKREAWGRLRKPPSDRWQVRYPGPDGEIYTARTDDDKPLTFLTKTDART